MRDAGDRRTVNGASRNKQCCVNRGFEASCRIAVVGDKELLDFKVDGRQPASGKMDRRTPRHSMLIEDQPWSGGLRRR